MSTSEEPPMVAPPVEDGVPSEVEKVATPITHDVIPAADDDTPPPTASAPEVAQTDEAPATGEDPSAVAAAGAPPASVSAADVAATLAAGDAQPPAVDALGVVDGDAGASATNGTPDAVAGQNSGGGNDGDVAVGAPPPDFGDMPPAPLGSEAMISTGADAAVGGGAAVAVVPSEAEVAAIEAEVAAAEAAATAHDGALLVRFRIQPEGFWLDQTFGASPAVAALNLQFSEALRVPNDGAFTLYCSGEQLHDGRAVFDIVSAPEPGMPLFVDVEFDGLPEHLESLEPGDEVQRVISTRATYGDDVGEPQSILVPIVRGFERKPFIGGYRHKENATVFHHAMAQTKLAPIGPGGPPANKVTRMTQTAGVTRSSQTQRECGTQMSRPDVRVDATYDRVVVAKPYFSAEALLELQAEKGLKIQAFVRGWKARKVARKLRDEKETEEDLLRTEDERRQREHQKKRDLEVERRMNPRKTTDFAVLYNELELWRLQEAQRITSAEDITPAERKQAMQELLKKETKLLQTIERLQIHAKKENRTAAIDTKLDKMSAPKAWGETKTVHVETPFTVRAKELKDLYKGLQLPGLSVDERLDVLLHVKWTVKEFDCPLTRDIVELIDREADLLNRGRKNTALSALRKRTANLFLQFLETPEFNPEAMQFQTIPLQFVKRPQVQLTHQGTKPGTASAAAALVSKPGTRKAGMTMTSTSVGGGSVMPPPRSA